MKRKPWPPPPAYNHTVKELGATRTLSKCEQRCMRYRNHEVSPVSGWSLCQSFTWVADTGRCVCIVDPWGWEPRKITDRRTISGVITWSPRRCSSEADCSYNGVCTNSLCECGAAWYGDRCQLLHLLPATRNTGLRIIDKGGHNTSTWGGSVIFDQASNVSHMWAAEMSHNCGLDTWTTNSRIVHATSSVPNGNYTRQSLVVPAFAHEPNVVRAPSGEFVMYYTASFPDDPPPEACMACTDGSTPADAECPGGPAGDGPTYMIYAKEPHGPWSKPQQLFNSQTNFTNLDTNLALVILPNNSVVGIARNEGPPTTDLTHLVTAEDWRDPESYKGRWTTLLFPNATVVDKRGVEDPFLYVDKRGVYHAVFHNQIENDDMRLCGGHAYSVDGLTWVFTGTSWGNRVRFSDGTTYTFSRRERPHFVFGDPKDPYKITALTTGVQYGAHAPISITGEDGCYTLLQPVNQVEPGRRAAAGH